MVSEKRDALKAVRLDAPESALALQGFQRVSYSCAFKIDSASAKRHTAEQWLRAIQEGTPTPLRWFVVGGWIAGLWLRLDLRSSSDHILGWRILQSADPEIVVGAEGRILSGRQVVQVTEDSLVHTTVVHYNSAVARVAWSVAEPIHIRVIPYLLRRAVKNLA
jgi:hypothetical protein